VGNEYTPTKTRADRDVENVNAVKDAAIGVTKGFAKAVGEAVDRLVPQGRDELANALFNGRAYWPGEQPMPLTDPQQQLQQDESHGVHGAPVASVSQETSQSVDNYLAGSYASYTDRLDDAAERGGNNNDRGRSR
jgi:hypothetical protein